IEDRRVDSLAIEVGEPRSGVESPRTVVVVRAHLRPTERADAVDPEARRDFSLDDEVLPSVFTAFDRRCALSQPRLQVTAPHIPRLEDVTVGVYDERLCRAHRTVESSAASSRGSGTTLKTLYRDPAARSKRSGGSSDAAGADALRESKMNFGRCSKTTAGSRVSAVRQDTSIVSGTKKPTMWNE